MAEQRQRGRGRGYPRPPGVFQVGGAGPRYYQGPPQRPPLMHGNWANAPIMYAMPHGIPVGVPVQRHPGQSFVAQTHMRVQHAAPPLVELSEGMHLLDIGATGDASATVAAASGAEATAVIGRMASRGRKNVTVDLLRTRPKNCTSKTGTSGQPIRLKTNYFKLLNHTDWRLYTYRVDFSPEEERTVQRKNMLRFHTKVIGGYIFDGTILYTSHRLEPEPLELFSNHPSDESIVCITLRLVADLAFGDHHYVQFFNIIMRKCLSHLKLQLVGRNYFDALAKIEVHNQRMELWPGYVTSIRQHESNILMNCEITHKVMRRDTVLDLLRECYQEAKGGDAQKLFKQRIVGCVVLTDYNNHTYRVDDVDWDVTPQCSFEMRDKSKISYSQYYKNKYQKNIRDVNQPMLVSRAKKREIRAGMAEMVYLVPELCRMTGLTDQLRANLQLMKALADHTRVAPDNRIQKLINFCERLRKQEDVMKDLREWDLKLADQLIELPARILHEESIVQGSGSEISYRSGRQADWTKLLYSNQMLVTSKVDNWVCVCPTMFKVKARDFVSLLMKAAAGMKFGLPTPHLYEISDDRVPNYIEALEISINKYQPKCILCVVSNNKLDRYSAIKKKCCVDRPVPTQVIVSKTFNNKGLMSVATKVAIQINCKMGGAPWGVEIPLTSVMVIGFDVCHDTMNKSKSYGAMVASLDRNCTRYFSAVSAHTNGEELSNDFALNIIKAVQKYKGLNNAPPEKILIYRDGVGDGQIPYVYQHEVDLIREKLEKAYAPKPLQMAFIVVSKRINTRFFFNGNNPPPGTVVDDIITLPERYDFFIVSQHVRQGSVSPTSYNVIYDTLGLDPDRIQRLTYKLCHMYYNWSGTVRVPAPCQYAHKLAFLVGQSLHRNPSNRLEDSLYFL